MMQADVAIRSLAWGPGDDTTRPDLAYGFVVWGLPGWQANSEPLTSDGPHVLGAYSAVANVRRGHAE